MRKILISTALIAVFSMIMDDCHAGRRGRSSGGSAPVSTYTPPTNNTTSYGAGATSGVATTYSGLTQNMKDKKEFIAENKMCFPALAAQGPALLAAIKAHVTAWKKEDSARKAALEEIRKTITSGTGGNEELDYQVSLADNSSLLLAAQALERAVTLIVKGGNKRDCSVAFRDAMNKANGVEKVMAATDAILEMANSGILAATNPKKINNWKSTNSAAKSSAPQEALYLTRSTDQADLNNGQAKAAIEIMDCAQNCWSIMRGGTTGSSSSSFGYSGGAGSSSTVTYGGRRR